MASTMFNVSGIRKLLKNDEKFGQEFFKVVNRAILCQVVAIPGFYSGVSPEKMHIAQEMAFENRKVICKMLFSLNDRDEYRAQLDETERPIFAAFIRGARDDDQVRQDIIDEFLCMLLEEGLTTYADFKIDNPV